MQEAVLETFPLQNHFCVWLHLATHAASCTPQ